jgi:branched-chain amino acid transport system substrate-binding protein
MLVQNDDAGREYSRALTDALGEGIKQQATFEHSDPSVDSQMLSLATSKADVLILVAPPKATTQGLRKAYDSGWKPQQTYILSGVSSVEHVLTPAGLDKVKGVISTAFLKDLSDPQWASDPAVKTWVANMNKYNPGMSLDMGARLGWINAEMVAQVIKQCGKDLSRENIMRQAGEPEDGVRSAASGPEDRDVTHELCADTAAANATVRWQQVDLVAVNGVSRGGRIGVANASPPETGAAAR